MIAGVRQFKLINALGREYDMTRPDALLHAPDGLGWGTERTVNRLGMTYIGINEKEIHQSPSGEMVFRTYEEYGRFLSFCQQGGLVLCYKPIDTWYYCECLISIQKSEIQWENNHLICPVQFTLLSYWYEKVVAQTAEPPEPAEPNYATVTGDPAVFNARYSYPIKDLSVAIQGSQDLNGYDKPWVGGAGRNLFDDMVSGNYTNEVELSAGTYYVRCWITSAPSLHTTNGYVYNNGSWVSIAPPYSAEGITVSGNSFGWLYSTTTKYQQTITIDEGYTFRIRYNRNDTAMRTRRLSLSKTELTEFSPYANICPITSYTSVTITQTGSQTNTYTVELTGAGQVYKGTLDVTSGELVVNNVVQTFNDTSGDWRRTSAYGNVTRFDLVDTSIKANSSASALTNMFAVGAIGTADLECFNIHGNNNIFQLQIRTDRLSADTVAGLGAWFANDPLQLEHELSTPLTYTLTPTQLNNLIGSNTIKADAGAVTVTYRTDARTEYKIYPYQYSYRYGDTAQNVFDISCDLPSYFKLTIFGEATNPSWRVVQNGSIVKSGKLNATIGSSQKLVINTDPKQTEIALYTLSNTRINNLYGYSDFATERIFALPQGESQVQVLTEDEQSPKVMIEVLKHV